MKSRLEAAARAEFDEAVDYYSARNPALGERFIDDVVKARLLIERHPGSGRLTSRQVRRILLSTFPYQLIYRVEDDLIRIYAVAHLKRRPTYWRDRLG